MTQNDRAYMTLMFEQILDQNKIVLEAVGDMRQTINHMPTMEYFEKLATKVSTIEFAIKDVSQVLRGHDSRITALENAA